MLETAIEFGFGCWYCGGKDGQDLLFSIEFDTPVHEHCLKKALKNDDDMEAKIMARELLE